MLALGLILIVGNTIKLLIVNRRHEIEIIKLVGGTNAFVRRPFLYYGTLFGLLGSLVCLILLLISAHLVKQPLAELATAYQTNTILYRLTFTDMLTIVLLGSLIGWLAARWSVIQHLRNAKAK